MTLTATSSIDNRLLIVNAILQSVAEDLDIPSGKYREAVERYTAVGRWLEAGEYPGSTGIPDIYVQGSFRLGTVVRPLKDGRESDYDIDLACQLRATIHWLSAKETKQMDGKRLMENGTYSEMLEDEGRRCWTLIYAEADGIGFHLDTLPCVPHPISALTVEPKYALQAIGITNRDEPKGPYEWTFSNPNGFADWFADCQRQAFNRVVALRKQEIFRQYPKFFASVADVPDQLVRTPLQRAVQLLKRHRDARFCGRRNETEKPISTIITTLAASIYRQENDVFSALANFLDQIQRYQETGIIRCEDGKWSIPNPANPGENFADRWNDEGSQRSDAFFEWIGWLQEDLDDLLNAATENELEATLKKAFSETTGKRIAAHYSGPMPGAYNQPTTFFNRIARQALRFDAAHKVPPRWRVQRTRYTAQIKAKYRRNGFRPTSVPSNSPPLPKRIELDFDVETDVPKPYSVFWQVVNTGAEAARANQLRGDFYDSCVSGRTHTETTKYQGMHWVEGFIVKDSVCVARTGEFVVNIL